ncbi:ABC transporter ATP-binding protein [Bradyrhizobium sp.]|uniref:ABC transporter ATP-binding protein n=1 Tax=Bradyrhizobium sp. TaxID=376 RepID=UPI0039E5BE65
MTTILRGRNIGVTFGKFQAVRDVDLDIETGHVHSIIGPNGAGKTTLFNVLSGRQRLTAGRIAIDETDVTAQPEHLRSRIGMARSFQINSLFWTFSVLENMRLAVQARDYRIARSVLRSDADRSEEVSVATSLCVSIGLGDQLHAVVDHLSHGQQRRLEIGLALASKPRLLLLDEPTSGMGVDDLPAMASLIRSLKRDGYTVVLVEHNMNLVMNLSDRITVMHQGRVLAGGSPAEISSDGRVREAYLGKGLDRA